MTLQEAEEIRDRLNNRNMPVQLTEVRAEVVRILPMTVDPVVEGDNGWDVEVTAL